MIESVPILLYIIVKIVWINDCDFKFHLKGGFRYLPFKSTEDAFRYSSNLGAYITNFEGDNVNSVNYNGQKLRMFSFMVYNNNGTKVIVPSSGYTEVSGYIAE